MKKFIFILLCVGLVSGVFAQSTPDLPTEVYFRNNLTDPTVTHLANPQGWMEWNTGTNDWWPGGAATSPNEYTHLVWTNATADLSAYGPTKALGVDSYLVTRPPNSGSAPYLLDVWGLTFFNTTDNALIGQHQTTLGINTFRIGKGGLTLVGKSLTCLASITLAASQTWDLGGQTVTLGSNGSPIINLNDQTLTVKNGIFSTANPTTINGGGELRLGARATLNAGENTLSFGANLPLVSMAGTGVGTANGGSEIKLYWRMAEFPMAIRSDTAAAFNRISHSEGVADLFLSGMLSGTGGFFINDASNYTFTENNTFTGDLIYSHNYISPGSIIAASPTAFGLGGLILGEKRDWTCVSISMVGSDPFTLTGNSYLRFAGWATRFLGAGDYAFDMPAYGLENRAANIINQLDSGKTLSFLQGMPGNGDETNARAINFFGIVGTTTLVDGAISNTGAGALLNSTLTVNGGKFDNETSTRNWQKLQDGEGNWIEKHGSCVILTGINTYTGATNVINGGMLIVNGITAASSLVTVNGATLDSAGNISTLGGLGTIGGNTTFSNGAILSPGCENTGILTFLGNLTLQSNSLLVLTSPEVSISVGGMLTLPGTWTLTLAPNANWATGTIEDTILVLAFNSLGTESLPSLINNTGVSGIGMLYVANEGLYLTGVTSAIPEPTTWALLGVSLLVATFLRRKKNS